MTIQESTLTLTIADIRRMASGDTPAAVALILHSLTDAGMNAEVLARICPLSIDEAEYIIDCAAQAGCDPDDWDSIPSSDLVDYSWCDDASDAYESAFLQILHAACCRVVDAE